LLCNIFCGGGGLAAVAASRSEPGAGFVWTKAKEMTSFFNQFW